ncbi:ABC transporter ATP-binding protein [Micromonospora sp. HUAS LYJ1]|uniref:ABC transporter ATP-binding protein n=1 Tax=Micromonospora sp. HUAS LYJ1 TaxID=3061626 RepID=UPI002673EC3F|nr:ABC transporter ATP-binding protein [Micromonospora sp. HUAS LYJ1]WKU03534.1 ABC transporter ATP-binding protein [Micromonospora sp. HUAS LYJ1]
MSDREVVLAAEGLRAGYGDILAIWDANIEIRRGEVTGLLGRNGAGKSTIFRALAGLATVQAGTVTWRGDDITALPPFKRAARGLAVVQEGKRIFRQRSIEENLLLGGFSTRLGRKALAGRVKTMYERFPVLADRRHEHAGGLSGGQQQMLAIAQALMSGPSAILLDEPTAGLAPSIVAEVLGVVTRLGREEGLAVLLIEQDVELVADIVTSATVLELGRAVYHGPPDPAAIRAAMEAVHAPRGTA